MPLPMASSGLVECRNRLLKPPGGQHDFLGEDARDFLAVLVEYVGADDLGFLVGAHRVQRMVGIAQQVDRRVLEEHFQPRQFLQVFIEFILDDAPGHIADIQHPARGMPPFLGQVVLVALF